MSIVVWRRTSKEEHETKIKPKEMIHNETKKHLEEWDEKNKYEPDIYHLDIGGFRKTLRHWDEHGDQDQHHGEVDHHDGLEEERLEEVGEVGDDNQQDCGNVRGQDFSQQSPDMFRIIFIFKPILSDEKKCTCPVPPWPPPHCQAQEPCWCSW